MTRCNKVRVEQIFTETWTLSTVQSEITRTLLDITEAECQNAIRDKCPTKNCNVKAPADLPPEYHYASDTKVSQDHIEVISVPSGIDYLEETIRVTPALGSESYPVADGRAISGKYIYLWDPDFDAQTCPFMSVQQLGCDWYEKPKDLISCRRSRFVIPDISNSVQLKGACSGISRSSSGLLYKWEDKSASPNRGAKRLALTPTANSDEHVASLRLQVSDAMEVLGEDLCQTQCEILDMMLRGDRNKEVLTRIGGSYMVLSKTGYLRKCHPAIGCQLVKPHQFCGNPNRVAVSCQGKIYMWNPKKGYLEDSTECERHRVDSKLVFTVGAHEYSIDDGLRVALPDKEHFGVAHDLVSRATDNISTEIVNPELLRQSWMEHINREASLSLVPLLKDRNVTQWEPDITFGFGFLKSAARIFTDIMTRITLWITVLLTLVAIVLGTKAWRNIRANKTVRTRQHHPVPATDTQVTWM